MTPEEFLQKPDLPKRELAMELHRYLLHTFPELKSELKWNAPSYAVNGQHRITQNFSGKNKFRLIFHCGPKTPEQLSEKAVLEDYPEWIHWPSNDRGILDLSKETDLEKLRKPLESFVRIWLDKTLIP